MMRTGLPTTLKKNLHILEIEDLKDRRVDFARDLSSHGTDSMIIESVKVEKENHSEYMDGELVSSKSGPSKIFVTTEEKSFLKRAQREEIGKCRNT